MSLPRARKDSNAPGDGGETSPSTGELGMVGFTFVPYEKFRPATSNKDIPETTNNGKSEMGNDGTSVGAYEFQPVEIDSETQASLSVASKGQKG